MVHHDAAWGNVDLEDENLEDVAGHKVGSQVGYLNPGSVEERHREETRSSEPLGMAVAYVPKGVSFDIRRGDDGLLRGDGACHPASCPAAIPEASAIGARAGSGTG